MKKTISTLTFLLMVLIASAQLPTPFLYYNFDNNIDDQIGTNNGTHMYEAGSSTTSPVYSAGKYGQCYEFIVDGSTLSNYIDLPEDLLRAGDASTEFTVATWIYMVDDANTITGNKLFVNFIGGTNPDDGVTAGTDRSLLMAVKKSTWQYANTYITGANVPAVPSGTTATGTEPAVLTPDAWHHLAITSKNNVAGDGTKDVTFYLDGTALETATASTIQNSFGKMQLGWKDGKTFRFNGKIDDFVIYKTALTESQIGTLMNGVPTSVYGDIEVSEQVNAYCSNKEIIVKTTLEGSKVVTVYNLSGSAVYASVENSNEFSTGKLSNGIYIVAIEANGKSARVKVSVK